MRPLLILPLLLILLAPPAGAHAAPDPPEYMTRLLHDYNDDWGSDASGTSLRDGHDLIALDLREEYNQTLGQDVLVLRLAMSHGYDADTTKPQLREVITFKAKGQTITREIKTTNNQQFTSDFDATYGPVPLRKADGSVDGGRFYVEGLLKFGTLGVKAGDKISDFFVQGYAATEKADHMVGGNAISDQQPPSEQSQPTSYRRSEYALRGPIMYVKSSLDVAQLTATSGDNRTITWTIVNNVGRAQTLTARAIAPAGVTIGLHSQQYTEGPLTLSVGAGMTATVHAYVLPTSNARSGDIHLTVETSLGGRNTHVVPLTIGTAAATSSAAPTTSATTPDESSPSIGMFPMLLGLFVLVTLLRRRSA